MDKFSKYRIALDSYPGIVTTIDRELFEYWLARSGKGKEQSLGLAIDSLKKQEAIDKFNAKIPTEQYAPVDFEVDGIRYDIKSSTTGNFSISNNERNFIRTCVRDGIMYGFQLYDADIESLTATFVGVVDGCQMEDLGLIKLSQFSGLEKQGDKWVEVPTWYLSRADAVKHLT